MRYLFSVNDKMRVINCYFKDIGWETYRCLLSDNHTNIEIWTENEYRCKMSEYTILELNLPEDFVLNWKSVQKELEKEYPELYL